MVARGPSPSSTPLLRQRPDSRHLHLCHHRRHRIKGLHSRPSRGSQWLSPSATRGALPVRQRDVSCQAETPWTHSSIQPFQLPSFSPERARGWAFSSPSRITTRVPGFPRSWLRTARTRQDPPSCGPMTSQTRHPERAASAVGGTARRAASG